MSKRVPQRAEEVFGYHREELLGRPVECLIPERFCRRHVDQRREYTTAPRTRPMGGTSELCGMRKGGAEFPVEVSLSPLRCGDELLIISVIRDVTERKCIQEILAQQARELARSNAELEQFAYAAWSTDGEKALAFLRREGVYAAAPRPDLILLDLNLPRKDGREVLQEIKGDATLKRIPVVVLTTSKAEEDIVRSYDLHANCYITKPVDLDQFISIVRAIEDFWFCLVKLPS